MKCKQRSPKGEPSGETCPSCGFISGVSDDVHGFSYDQWREQWVAGGMAWTLADVDRPQGWNPVHDLKALFSRKHPVIPKAHLQKASELRVRLASGQDTSTS